MTERLDGHGPWTFEIPALNVGESHYLDFREMRYNKRKGFFRDYLPFDRLQVTNQSGQTLEITLNNVHTDIVVPNAVESYDDMGVTYLEVTNEGSNTTSAGDITVSAKRSPFDADDMAREQANRGPVRRAINHFTGL